ncbi:MAG: SIMPL domain-containing protein [Proteobacteria bacterium]|nr:SIMPL domain-containing protein [Pseudomonadota bacterium]
MMKKTSIILLTVLFTVFSSINSFAETDELPKHEVTTVSISEKASILIMPDTFSAMVEFKDKGFTSKGVQQEVNKQVDFAIKKIKDLNIEYELKSFRTRQEYKSSKHTASQSIFIETKDAKKLEQITSILQKNKGLVTNTRSYIKDVSTPEYFDKLFDKAFKKATKKAELLTKKVKGTKYHITNMNYYMSGQNRSEQYRARGVLEARVKADAPENINVDDTNKKVILNLTLSIMILQK